VTRASGTLVIRGAADLQALRRGPPRWRAITVMAPALAPGEQARWQDRLAHDYGGCGCETGQYFMLAGLVGVAVLTWQTWSRDGWTWHQRGLWGFGLLVTAALLGKLAGLWVARRRLRRSISELGGLLE
jgi:hypothetical protein